MINLAFIGLGRIADVHHAAVTAAGGRCRVAAVCDADAAVVEARSRAWGVPGFGDISMLFASELGIDAVVVMVPPAATERVVGQCAGRVKAILLEKPLATTITAATRIGELCTASGTPLLLGHNGLFHPAFSDVRQAIRRGEIGELLSASAESSGWLRFRDNDFRRSLDSAGGGVWMDTGSHLVYTLRDLCGEVVGTNGLFANRARKEMQGEDHALVHLSFASGAIASIEASYGRKRPCWQKDWPEGYLLQFCLWGSDGAIRYRLCPETRTEIFQREEWRDLCPASPFSLSFERQLSHFLDCVEGTATPAVSVADGIAVMRTLEQAYNSPRTRNESAR